jgi:predicted transcriptional regulator
MTKKKLLLISLQEDEAKNIAQVISNQSCRKILDYLAEKEATETEIANMLNIPISTAHYNLQQLIKSGLVNVEHFHYSKKGKEINHYKLANQYIIIAPKKTYGIKEKLKSILPVGIVTLIGAGLIQSYYQFLSPIMQSSDKIVRTATRQMSDEAVMESVADSMLYSMPESSIATQTFPNYALWFLIGGFTVIITYIILDIIKHKINNRRN